MRLQKKHKSNAISDQAGQHKLARHRLLGVPRRTVMLPDYVRNVSKKCPSINELCLLEDSIQFLDMCSIRTHHQEDVLSSNNDIQFAKSMKQL